MAYFLLKSFEIIDNFNLEIWRGKRNSSFTFNPLLFIKIIRSIKFDVLKNILNQ